MDNFDNRKESNLYIVFFAVFVCIVIVRNDSLADPLQSNEESYCISQKCYQVFSENGSIGLQWRSTAEEVKAYFPNIKYEGTQNNIQTYVLHGGFVSRYNVDCKVFIDKEYGLFRVMFWIPTDQRTTDKMNKIVKYYLNIIGDAEKILEDGGARVLHKLSKPGKGYFWTKGITEFKIVGDGIAWTAADTRSGYH